MHGWGTLNAIFSMEPVMNLRTTSLIEFVNHSINGKSTIKASGNNNDTETINLLISNPI